jgi:hypothetical protein
MNKTILLLPVLIILTALPSAAYAQADIISNSSYEINIIPGPKAEGGSSRPMNKCQAVRLNKDWFLTAAHCVQNQCNSGCTLQARLFLGPGYEVALQYYASSPLDDVIKVYNSRGADKSNIAYDIALIQFPPERSQYVYILGNYRVPQDMFMQSAKPDTGAMAAAVNGTAPPRLLVLRTETPKIFNRQIVVPSIWGGARQMLASHDTIYYSPANQYIFTDNFGIRQGISGAGVFTAAGELCGVVSSTGVLRQSSGDINALNYTFLTVFNEDVLRFITRYAGNTAGKTADMDYFKVIPEDQREFVFAVESAVK